MGNLSSANELKYVHEDDAHNLRSPNVIVPHLVRLLRPESVVDVGCGIGTFLHVFKQQGVQDILGLDGGWVDRKKLYISETEFQEVDLEGPIRLSRAFDLVICLEVAEHLAPAAASTIVESLTSLGRRIVFSAATIKQGGQHHINEQAFSYWKEKFAEKNYKVVDCFRPHFWNEEDVQWWYKQNMFLVLHESVDATVFENSKEGFSDKHLLIHPELYYERIGELERMQEAWRKMGAGEGGNVNLYIKLLLRSIKKRFRK